jgi:hypothetical protein
MALLRETGVGGEEGARLPYPRQVAPVARAIAWKPSSDAYYLLAANLRNSGYEHEIYITQRVLLQIQEHAASTERDVDGSLWGRVFVSPDSGATYVVIADAAPGTDAGSARTGPQMDGPLRLAGWYCSRHTADTQPTPEDLSIHLERCTGGWEPLLVLSTGGQPTDGSLFLVNPMSGRAFRAPFRELLEPHLVRENAPKRSCIPWRGYVTDEPVVALPIRDRGAARRSPAADEPRSTVSIIAEGVAADVRAAARAVGRVMGAGAASRTTVNIPTAAKTRKPLPADAAAPATPEPPEAADRPEPLKVRDASDVATPDDVAPPVVETEVETPRAPLAEWSAAEEEFSPTPPPLPPVETSHRIPLSSPPPAEPVTTMSAPPLEEPGPASAPGRLVDSPAAEVAPGPAPGSAPGSVSRSMPASGLLATESPPPTERESPLLQPRDARDVSSPGGPAAPPAGEASPSRLADVSPWHDEDMSSPPFRRAILPSDVPRFERRASPRVPPRKPVKVDEERAVPASVLIVAAVAALVASLALLGIAVQRLIVARAPVAASQAGAVGAATGNAAASIDESAVPGSLPRTQARLLVARTDSLRVAMAWYQEMAADHRAGKLGCALVVQARDRLIATRDSLGSLLATVPEGSRVMEQRRLLVEADRMERQAAARCRPSQR